MVALADEDDDDTDSFLSADCHARYEHALVPKQVELDVALQVIHYIEDCTTVHTYLADCKLTFGDICELAETQYCNAVGNKCWVPQHNLVDSKKPPETFTNAQVNTLIQYVQGKGDSGSCHKSNNACPLFGERGNWNPKCPKKDTLKPSSEGNQGHSSSCPNGVVHGPSRGGHGRGCGGHGCLQSHGCTIMCPPHEMDTQKLVAGGKHQDCQWPHLLLLCDK